MDVVLVDKAINVLMMSSFAECDLSCSQWYYWNTHQQVSVMFCVEWTAAVTGSLSKNLNSNLDRDRLSK